MYELLDERRFCSFGYDKQRIRPLGKYGSDLQIGLKRLGLRDYPREKEK